MRTFIIKMICISIAVLFLTNCSNSNSSRHADKVDNVSCSKSDSIEISTLIKNMYRWYETKSSKGEFIPTTKNPKDTIYSGIDWKAHENRMNELIKTHFFAKDFLDNYQKIASHIDNELKQGHSEWRIGELPPFGTDANPWCNCQDYPDNYWNKLTITDIKMLKDSANFKWTWGGNFYYSVKVKKELGVWRISYLEGFDYKNYTETE
jgi:hypothetical protein